MREEGGRRRRGGKLKRHGGGEGERINGEPGGEFRSDGGREGVGTGLSSVTNSLLYEA